MKSYIIGILGILLLTIYGCTVNTGGFDNNTTGNQTINDTDDDDDEINWTDNSTNGTGNWTDGNWTDGNWTGNGTTNETDEDDDWFGNDTGNVTPGNISEELNITYTYVDIEDFNFTPSEVNITVGSGVVWANRDGINHTVVFGDIPAVIGDNTTDTGDNTTDTGNQTIQGDFESSIIEPGSEWRYVFNDTGTYEYYSSLYPNMTGRVVVQ